MTSELIQVQFIDVATGKVFANAGMPPDQLPESFLPDTTLNIHGELWHVDSADPTTRLECLRSGSLRLTLGRILTGPPEELFYTMPTICDKIPPVDEEVARVGERVLELHEDNWRQIEFISSTNRAEAEAEVQQVISICKNHKKAEEKRCGFAKIHLRRTPERPLDDTISLAELATLPRAVPYDGVAYWRVTSLIKDAFAYRYGNFALYGVTHNGIVQSLSVEPLEEGQSLPTQPIAALMDKHDLFLVDWCQVTVIAGADQLEAHLREIGL